MNCEINNMYLSNTTSIVSSHCEAERESAFRETDGCEVKAEVENNRSGSCTGSARRG